MARKLQNIERARARALPTGGVSVVRFLTRVTPASETRATLTLCARSDAPMIAGSF
jgi:hypothetical protein